MKVILLQMATLSFIGLIGFVSVRSGLIRRQHTDGLAKVIMKITLPLLIFTTFAEMRPMVGVLRNFPVVLSASVLVVVAMFFVSKLTSHCLHLDRQNAALHSVHSMFGNDVFLGFPLLDALFPGGEGLVYATIFQLGHDSLMWTWGLLILTKSTGRQSTRLWKHLLNPATVAFVAGLICMLCHLHLPRLLLTPLHQLGHTTVCLSMIYVGAVLAGIDFMAIFRNGRSYVLSFNKLVVGPAILTGLFVLLRFVGCDISATAVMCAVLQSAMPCMIIISVIAEELCLNSLQAAENILISSLFSIITLPAIYWVLRCIFGVA